MDSAHLIIINLASNDTFNPFSALHIDHVARSSKEAGDVVIFPDYCDNNQFV